jgi:hypothetical protein
MEQDLKGHSNTAYCSADLQHQTQERQQMSDREDSDAIPGKGASEGPICTTSQQDVRRFMSTSQQQSLVGAASRASSQSDSADERSRKRKPSSQDMKVRCV